MSRSRVSSRIGWAIGLIISLTLQTQSAFAQLGLSAGGVARYIGGEVSVTATSASGWVGQIAPYLQMFWLDPSYFGESGIQFVLGSRLGALDDAEGKVLSSFHRTGVRWQKAFAQGTSLAIGPSVEWEWYRGSGGTENVRNGNSSSNFPVPARWVGSVVWSMDAQLDSQIPGSRFGVSTQLWWFGGLGSKRSLSGAFLLSYRVGGPN